MKKIWRIGLLLSLFSLSLGVLSPVISATVTDTVYAAKKKTKKTPKVKKKIQITAIGDSLTYGVGDGAKNHGYVGLIKKTIEKKYKSVTVVTHNYGVSGDTSAQILKRVQENKKLQEDVKNSDAVVMTMGGNDIMHVIEKDPANVTTQAVSAQAQTMGQNLNQIISLVRQQQSEVPVFVIGLYNPFYVLVPTVTTMQTAVANWNDNTKNVLKMNVESYFVPVDSVLTKGDKKTQKIINKRLKAVAKEKASSSTSSSSTTDFTAVTVKNDTKKELVNPYLYKKDHFHPNHTGYVRMTNQLYQVMTKHKSLWLYQKN
ncbi:GDSL-type esterase/lipase family protein [Agrilactobacillus yilanensis]|uniref:GDSL-type esterase/lipase family protein n=1 Tax=Agrilactobacillus yilanensis TaxID=2485997 RepID=A0ABW4J603_9LACO|nr:GDSL-type esterase/lipase family protein [Agrilactobacillus yilanensis]